MTRNSTARNRPFSFNKATSAGMIRFNLMIASLYLLTYEVLYDSVVEGTRSFFDIEPKLTPEQKDQLDNLGEQLERLGAEMGQDLGPHPLSAYRRKIEQFKEDVGASPFTTGTTQLLRACARWLHSKEVLNEADLETVEEVLRHRHEVAHELPQLMTAEGLDVDTTLFPRMYDLISKVDLFWFRNDWFDSSSVLDEEFQSPRLVILRHMAEAVAEWSA